MNKICDRCLVGVHEDFFYCTVCWWDVATALRSILRNSTTKHMAVGSKMMLLRMIIPFHQIFFPRPPENLLISENSKLLRNLVCTYLEFTEPIVTDWYSTWLSLLWRLKSIYTFQMEQMCDSYFRVHYKFQSRLHLFCRYLQVV